MVITSILLILETGVVLEGWYICWYWLGKSHQVGVDRWKCCSNTRENTCKNNIRLEFRQIEERSDCIILKTRTYADVSMRS